MKPSENQFVKIFFKNGTQVEGIVQEWGKQIILSSENSNSVMVITKPNQIIMYKIVKELKPQNKVNDYNPPTVIQEKKDEDYIDPGLTTHYNWEIQEEDPNVPKEYLDAKSKVELHKLKIKEEKEVFAKKLKEHQLGEVRKVEYTSHEQLPGLYQK